MCTNCMMIAKTYNRLHNKEKAVEYLKKTMEFTIRTPDDEQVINFGLKKNIVMLTIQHFTAKLS